MDNLQGWGMVATMLFVFSGIGLIVASACSFMSYSDSDRKTAKMAVGGVRSVFVPALLIALALNFVPTSKQYAMIKIFPKIANSDIAKEMPQDAKEIYQMAKDYLKSMVKVEAVKR